MPFSTFSRSVVLCGLESNAEPHSNLLGVPPAVGSDPILRPPHPLQPFIEKSLREGVQASANALIATLRVTNTGRVTRCDSESHKFFYVRPHEGGDDTLSPFGSEGVLPETVEADAGNPSNSS